MKAAFGGIANLVFVVVFFTIAIGALGLTVSYSKAFHMKSAIIQTIEEYEGAGCFGAGVVTSACRERIRKEAQRLTYNPPDLHCPSGYTKTDNFCYAKKDSTYRNGKKTTVVTVLVQVDLDFPVIEQITSWKVFRVAGDTKEIKMQ